MKHIPTNIYQFVISSFSDRHTDRHKDKSKTIPA